MDVILSKRSASKDLPRHIVVRGWSVQIFFAQGLFTPYKPQAQNILRLHFVPLRMTRLTNSGNIQNFVQVIQHPLFISRPERGDQVFFCTVTGDSVNHDVLRQDVHALFQNFSVLF